MKFILLINVKMPTYISRINEWLIRQFNPGIPFILAILTIYIYDQFEFHAQLS